MSPSNLLENKIPSEWRVQLVFMKVQAHSYSVQFPTTGIQSGPDIFNKSMLLMTFLTNLEVKEY